MASEKDQVQPPTSSDLLSSAKLVADAAKSTFNSEGEKVDKGKVAGAAADLLDAAKDYGKLEKDQGVGQYVEKAETYLHQYESSQSNPTKAAEPKPADQSHESGKDNSAGTTTGGGVGDYLKMAQGFLNK